MMDKNLKSYVIKYNRWLVEKLISHSSQVIPVNESLDGIKHMIPSVQAVDILKQAQLITLPKLQPMYRALSIYGQTVKK